MEAIDTSNGRQPVHHAAAGGSLPERAIDGWLWLAALALVIAASAVAFSSMSADTDLWGHLRFGEAHWESGHLARLDPYSFTGKGAWINHEWLAELVLALSYRVAGDRGLLAVKLVLGLAMMAMLAWVCARRRASALAVAVVLPLAAFAMAPGFMFRPQLFSFLLFAVVLALLRVDAPGDRRAVLALPLVLLLWVNLHGAFLMGCAAVAAVVLSETAAAVLRRRSLRPLRWLWIAAVAAALACLVNPYGWGLLRFLLSSLSLPRPIGEWSPLPLADLSFPEIKLVAALAIGLGAWMAWHRRLRPAEAAVVVLTLYATLKHQRHAPFLVMAAAPLIADGLSRLGRPLLRRLEPGTGSALARRAVIGSLVIVAAIQLVSAGMGVAATGGRIFVDPTLYPVQATALLARNGARGRLLLAFEWGEYAIWHLSPACRVSIDGRFRTVYPEPVLSDHYLAAVDPRHWRLLLARYEADLAMLPRSAALDELVRRGIPGWVVVHLDPLSVVLVRSDGASAALVAAGRSLLRPGPPRLYFP